MKGKFGVKLVANIFIILSSLGILFSLAGIAGTWIYKPGFYQGVFSAVKTFQQVMTTTDEGLTVLDDALETTRINFSTIETTLEDLDTTFGDIVSSLDSTASLVGDDLRLTIIESQTALESSATTAQIIDKTLSIIAAIPLIGANYKPEVPLHISLTAVAESLGDVPTSLETVEQSMKDTSGGLSVLQTNLAELSENLSGFDQDLLDAQLVLRDYDKTIKDVLTKLDKLQKNLPLYVTLLSLTLTGMFLSFGIAQACIFIFGLAYRKGDQQIVYLTHPHPEEEETNLAKEI